MSHKDRILFSPKTSGFVAGHILYSGGNPSVGSVASAASDDTAFVSTRNIVPLSPGGLSLNLGSKYVNSDTHKESVHSGWRNVSPSIQLNQGDNARG